MRVTFEFDSGRDESLFRGLASHLPNLVQYIDKFIVPVPLNMVCVGVLNPPTVYSPVPDSGGRAYYIKILLCQLAPGGVTPVPAWRIPYVSFNAMAGAVPPAAATRQLQRQFQTYGVLPGTLDPSAVEYYQTMTVTQDAPGSAVFRHRLFNTPSVNPLGGVLAFPQSALTPTLADVIVSGNDPEIVFPVHYVHRRINNTVVDPDHQADLFLQQPF
jgi:hypothetical protein